MVFFIAVWPSPETNLSLLDLPVEITFMVASYLGHAHVPAALVARICDVSGSAVREDENVDVEFLADEIDAYYVGREQREMASKEEEMENV